MRLDKYISNASELSRKQVHRLIKQGLVSVDGEIANSPASHIETSAEVVVDGELISLCGPRYIMLHKPAGYVCANADSEHPTVLDLLDEPRLASLQICGRLDIDTTGLVLLSDDGQWNHRVTSPNKNLGKRYLVCLKHTISAEQIAELEAGIRLEGEPKPCKPAKVERLYDNEVLVTISEGRYHQVKRMFGAVGNRVLELHRQAVGPLEIKELAEGDYRHLSPEEVELI
ncbi:MAG: pseudouridine synthase [Cellvibrionaceae bacterium]|nr:pseudouridine synthase [Cellvibrionaceae bacterium]MCV6627903.1 pseudouridine synthase [Cellvibrionaceae bacterium]